ncbi:MAG: hypothetical protein RLZZ511_374 [Cyanobacteriota bacterium]|jgi:uncharacterized protein (TIGR02646 family)
MRFIPKNPEPASFADWKQQANSNWQPSFTELRNPEKPELLGSLLKEQGYICCYCCQRIGPTNSHIEHLKPQKHCLEAEKIAYENLLASCPGYLEEEIVTDRLPQEFCGQKKGDWYNPDLMVSPLDPHCAAYFRYTAAGEILPTTNVHKQTAAQTTIERLGLNHPKLDRGRRTALEGILDDLESLTNDDLKRLIISYNRPNENGQLIPYCAAITHQLQQLLPK